MGRVRLLVRCLLAAVLLGGCNGTDETDVASTADGILQLGSVVASDTVRRAVALGTRTLVLNDLRGTVTLAGTTATVAQLRFRKQGRGASAIAAHQTLRGIRILESGTPQRFTYAAERDAPDRSTVDVTGSIPHATALRLENTRGAVQIADLAGPITLRHPFGTVNLMRMRGAVDVDIQSGDLMASFAALPDSGTVRLRTANGDITLALPPDASATLTAETQVGWIQTPTLPLTDQRLTPLGAGFRYTGRLGAGRQTVRLSTDNGRITVQQVVPSDAITLDSKAVPPADSLSPSDTTTLAPPPPAPSNELPQRDSLAP